MRLVNIISIISALTLAACGRGQAPIKVEKTKGYLNTTVIIIRSISNDPIKIKDITANRGNCQIAKMDIAANDPPIHFGEGYPVTVFCDPIQIDVSIADSGTWTFNFD